jgi:hypothetical protein
MQQRQVDSTFPIPAPSEGRSVVQYENSTTSLNRCSESLVGLLGRLETRVRHDAPLEKQYGAVEEALDSTISLASTKPGETDATGAPTY